MVAYSVVARGFGFARTAAAFEGLAVMAALALPAFLAFALLAATDFPLVDERLIAADGMLGFNWLSMNEALRAHESVFKHGETIYLSLRWQPTLLVVVLAMTMRHLELWRFVTAWFVALAITMVIFPFTPAVGGFIHYGLDHHDLPHLSEESISGWYGIFDSVRSGTVYKLGANTITGIVTFPSFHAAAAVLLGYGYMAVNWLRWPMLALNVGLFVSSIVIGGHYLVDVLAGGLIAVIAIVIVRRLPYLRNNEASNSLG